MTNFEKIWNTFAATMAAAGKFGGFVTPNGVAWLVNKAASALEAGKEEKAVSLLREAQDELARTLRAFINGSPGFFRRQLAEMKPQLDHPAFVDRLGEAIDRYAVEVKGAGWLPAAEKYNKMSAILTAAPKESERLKAAIRAAVRRQEAVAAAAEKSAVEAARREAAEGLRRLVVRKVA